MNEPSPCIMTTGVRLVVFLLSLACITPALPHVIGAFPVFGNHPLPYGDLINRLAPAERHVTNAVSAVNFDFRGFDTLGEEVMLMVAITGTAMLLRGTRGESITALPATVPGRRIPPHSEALVLVARWFAPVIILFGFYVVLHATVTPGGGFQGGAIIASGLSLLYLGEGYRSWRRFMRNGLLDAIEGGGAAAYALAGFGPVMVGMNYLQNVLPPGEMKSMLSGGLMLILNAAVGAAVAGGFSIIFVEFLEETRAEDPEQ